MERSGLKTGVLTAAVILTALTGARAMIPSPIISRGKTVKASNGNSSQLIDGKFGSGAFTVSASSWFAIDVGTGPSKIFISWNNPAYTWSDKIADPNRSDCKQTLSYPIDYTIQTSANSTDGIDGDWTIAATVKGNNVSARGHEVDFTGKKWVKMNITSGGGIIDEVEVFNTSNGAEDIWFFAGTSISANAYKSSTSAKIFSTIINEAHKEFNPAMIRGGIPCISSNHIARDISMYLETAGNCHYWTIEMGTNDAWGGSNSNVATFKSSLQKVIDSCKVHNIEPIIANVLSTNQSAAGWQVHGDYAKAVEDLTKSNSLIEGADFYAGFQANTSWFNSDGVHPNNAGAAGMHRLRAEKMDALYKTVASRLQPSLHNKPRSPGLFTAVSKPGRMEIFVTEAGTLSLFRLNGSLVENSECAIAGRYNFFAGTGCTVVRYRTVNGAQTDTATLAKSQDSCAG